MLSLLFLSGNLIGCPFHMSTDRFGSLRKNIDKVRARIDGACRRCGRDPSEVTLIAVTKAVDPEVARLVLDAGIDHIGENRVQEAERKRAVLGNSGTWHLIGHLQRNKAKKAVSLFSMIHSVDSIRLLEEIAKTRANDPAPVDILLEVNVSGETSKHGFDPGGLDEAIRKADSLPGIRLRGLMTMAPYDPDAEAARPWFRKLKELHVKAKSEGSAGQGFDVLSMGMSGDFEVAVEEGATHVRIGTALYKGLD